LYLVLFAYFELDEEQAIHFYKVYQRLG